MAAISNINKYIISNFQEDTALEGGLIFAQTIVVERGENIYKYFLVSDFKINNTSKYPSCKYTGIIENKLIYFTQEAVSYGSSIEYTLKMATSTISGGDGVGNTVTTRGGSGEEVKYTLNSLNYRENVAKEVLGFLINNIQNPEALTDEKITYLISAAFRFSFEFVNQAIDLRNNNKEIEEQQEAAVADPSAAMDEGTFWNLLLENIKSLKSTITPSTSQQISEGSNVIAKLEALRVLYSDYVRHTPSQGESSTKTTVGLDDLIVAIKEIQGGGGDVNVKELPNINMGNQGLGRDVNNPIYISGGGFPTRNSLAAELLADAIHDFLTFNSAGAVAYSSKIEVKKAILGYLNSYANIDALASAIYNKIQTNIDNRIKAWLQAAKVSINGTDYNITVNTPI